MHESDFTLGKIVFSQGADGRHLKDRLLSDFDILASYADKYHQKKLFDDTKMYLSILEGKDYYSKEAIAFKNMDCDDKFCLILDNIEKIKNTFYKSILEDRLSQYEN